MSVNYLKESLSHFLIEDGIVALWIQFLMKMKQTIIVLLELRPGR